MTGDELPQERDTVVVIDDDAAIVELVCDVLADVGVTATGSVEPEEAVALIQRVAPRLVILDVVMPGVDGLEILRQLRAAPETAALPVLFLTASVKELPEHILASPQGRVELLRKPFDLDALLEVVEEVLGN